MQKVYVFYDKETGKIEGYGSSPEPGTKEIEVPDDHRLLVNPGLFYFNDKGAIEYSLTEEARVAESRLRRQQIEFLKETDWIVARHRDQVELGVTTTLSEEEYNNLLVRRHDAREGTLTFDE